MKIADWLRKSEKLVFWNRCRIHAGKADFRRMVLDGYRSPDFLELHHFGDDYAGRTIYYASETGDGVGFFAELGMTLIKLYFADDRGFVPYVHWGENYLYYEPEGIRGEKNAFLYYFKPVSEVRSIEHASHVVFPEESHFKQVKGLYGAVSYDVSEDYVNAMAQMMKKYIQYNDATRQYLEEQYFGLLGNHRVLGVHYRGTDFRKQYNNHPIPVKVEQEIAKVKELMEKSDYEKIFLATDESSVVDKFREQFNDKVVIFEDTFRDDGSGESIAFSKSDRDNHHYRLGLEVLRDQYTLTHCNGIVCGYSNITFIARVMRRAWFENDWEDYVLINNGLYHNNNRFSDSENAQRKCK